MVICAKRAKRAVLKVIFCVNIHRREVVGGRL
jgi:hypothetical protein